MMIYLILWSVFFTTTILPVQANDLSMGASAQNYLQQKASYESALQNFHAAKSAALNQQAALVNAQEDLETRKRNFAVQEDIWNDAQKLEHKAGVEVSPAIKQRYVEATHQVEEAQVKVVQFEKTLQDTVQQQNSSQNLLLEEYTKLKKVQMELSEAIFKILQQQIGQEKEVSVTLEQVCNDEMTKKQCRDKALDQAKSNAIKQGIENLLNEIDTQFAIKDSKDILPLQLSKNELALESDGVVLNFQSELSEFTTNGNFSLRIKALIKVGAKESMKQRLFKQTAALSPPLPEEIEQSKSAPQTPHENKDSELSQQIVTSTDLDKKKAEFSDESSKKSSDTYSTPRDADRASSGNIFKQIGEFIAGLILIAGIITIFTNLHQGISLLVVGAIAASFPIVTIILIIILIIGALAKQQA